MQTVIETCLRKVLVDRDVEAAQAYASELLLLAVESSRPLNACLDSDMPSK